MPSTILITGANRGLGLELTRQYAAEGWRVLACCRRPEAAAELQAIERDGSGVSIHRLDITRPEQIAALQKELAGQPIDLLFNNAGVLGGERQEFGEVTAEPWLAAFQANAVGPLLMAQAFAGEITASERKIIACMGTQMASIGDNRSGGYYIYRSTKAALHMTVKNIAVDLRPRGIIAVVLHPGWVQTDMGGAGATLSPAESVRGLRRVLASLTPEDTGRFLDYSGRELPW